MMRSNGVFGVWRRTECAVNTAGGNMLRSTASMTAKRSVDVKSHLSGGTGVRECACGVLAAST